MAIFKGFSYYMYIPGAAIWFYRVVAFQCRPMYVGCCNTTNVNSFLFYKSLSLPSDSHRLSVTVQYMYTCIHILPFLVVVSYRPIYLVRRHADVGSQVRISKI